MCCSCPRVFTFGLLFLFVPFIVNTVLLWLTDKLIGTFSIETCGGLLTSAAVITLVNWLLQRGAERAPAAGSRRPVRRAGSKAERRVISRGCEAPPIRSFGFPCLPCGVSRARPARLQEDEGQGEGGGGGDPSQVVAKVDDAVITVGDVQERINKQSPFIRARYTTNEKKKEFLDSLIRFEVMANEAERRGYDKDPEVMRVMKQQMISKFLQKDFESKLKVEDVPDADVEKYYKEHPAEFNQKDEVRVSEIVVKDKAKADKAYAEAKALPKAPRSPDAEQKGFRDIVTKYSEDEDVEAARRRSRVLRQGLDAYPKPIVEAAFKLAEVGDVAPPDQDGQGLGRHPADAEASRVQPAAGRGQAPDPAAPVPRHAHQGDGQLRRRAEEEERDRGQRREPGQGRHRHRRRTHARRARDAGCAPPGMVARAPGCAPMQPPPGTPAHAARFRKASREAVTPRSCSRRCRWPPHWSPARGAAARTVEKIAAVVGDNVVLASEVEEKAAPLLADVSKVTDPDKRAARAASLRREVLDRLIDDELILQQAAELKLTMTSEQVDASIEEIKKQNNIDDDQLREALRGQGMSMATYRADLKRQLLRFRVLNIAVGSRVNVSDEEVKAYYERHMKGSGQHAGARQPHLHRDPRRRRRGDGVPRSRRRRRRSSSARRPARTSPSWRASCPTTPPRAPRAATWASSARTCCPSRSRSWCSR